MSQALCFRGARFGRSDFEEKRFRSIPLERQVGLEQPISVPSVSGDANQVRLRLVEMGRDGRMGVRAEMDGDRQEGREAGGAPISGRP